MIRIIGHRGVKGTELENSPSSFQAAFELPIDAIELDVHRTKDNKIVVIHDDTTKRVADRDVHINDVTLAEIRQLNLKNGQHIPTLDEILSNAVGHQLYLDVKDMDCAALIVQLLKNYPGLNVGFVSRHASELQQFRALLPDAQTYIYFLKAENIIPHPIRWVRIARSIQATGIGLDKAFLNPITYSLAMRAGLKMYTYSVDTALLARVLHLLYSQIDFCTGYPERLIKVFKKS